MSSAEPLKSRDGTLYYLEYFMTHGGGGVTVDAEAVTNRMTPILSILTLHDATKNYF